MDKQVDKTHYQFERYGQFIGRWVSYFHQVRIVTSLKARRVLEVGVGDKVLQNYLLSNTKIEYVGVDIDPDLNPDIVADVLSLPFADGEFEIVCAFEVLEHLPFSKFETALQELQRVSSKYVVLSLPHFGPPVKLSFKVPFLPEVKLAWKIPWPRQHVFNGQHYWEIGKRGYGAGKIKKILSRFFAVQEDFIPFENQYHHFYILRKRQ